MVVKVDLEIGGILGRFKFCFGENTDYLMGVLP